MKRANRGQRKAKKPDSKPPPRIRKLIAKALADNQPLRVGWRQDGLYHLIELSQVIRPTQNPLAKR